MYLNEIFAEKESCCLQKPEFHLISTIKVTRDFSSQTVFQHDSVINDFVDKVDN